MKSFLKILGFVWAVIICLLGAIYLIAAFIMWELPEIKQGVDFIGVRIIILTSVIIALLMNGLESASNDDEDFYW